MYLTEDVDNEILHMCSFSYKFLQLYISESYK